MAEVRAIICSHVYRSERPVNLVVLAGGEWMLLCGEEHGDDEKYEVAGINHLYERDPSLLEVSGLVNNESAERDHPGAKWQVKPWTEG